MTLDPNALRKLGFTKKQSLALAPALQAGGSSIQALPPYVPVASKVQVMVNGHFTGHDDWEAWFGGATSSYYLGAYTAMATELLTLPGNTTPADHKTPEGSSGGTIAVVPADLPPGDWNTTEPAEGGNGLWVNEEDSREMQLDAGRKYHVFLFSYDTDPAYIDHELWYDYTAFWNAFQSHMLPPGEVCSVLDTGSELFLIPNETRVQPKPATIRSVNFGIGITASDTADPDGTYPLAIDMRNVFNSTLGLDQVGATWDGEHLVASAPRQLWTISVVVGVQAIGAGAAPSQTDEFVIRSMTPGTGDSRVFTARPAKSGPPIGGATFQWFVNGGSPTLSFNGYASSAGIGAMLLLSATVTTL